MNDSNHFLERSQLIDDIEGYFAGMSERDKSIELAEMFGPDAWPDEELEKINKMLIWVLQETANDNTDLAITGAGAALVPYAFNNIIGRIKKEVA